LTSRARKSRFLPCLTGIFGSVNRTWSAGDDNDEGINITMLGASSLAVDAKDANLFNAVSLSRLAETAGFEVPIAHTPGRLEAEFVPKAALEGEVRLDPFLHRVLVDEWERLGWPYQMLFADQGLSSHMWLAAGCRG
jgi:hypothetical protein